MEFLGIQLNPTYAIINPGEGQSVVGGAWLICALQSTFS